MTIRTTTARIAACAALVASGALPAAAQNVFGPAVNTATPALAAFQTALAGIKDYTCESDVVEHSNDGAKTQVRSYRIEYVAPHAAVTFVTAGPGAGGGAAWRGGDKVKGHQGGAMSHIKLILPIDDPRATSMRGNTIDAGLFPFDLSTFMSYPGTLAQADGPMIDGQATTQVTNVFAKPAPKGETKVVMDISNDTHLPVEYDAFVGDTQVVKEVYKNVKLNTGLTIDDMNVT